MKDIAERILDALPQGSGFDSPWEFDRLTSTGNLKYYGHFHNMDEWGGYDGWSLIILTVPVLDPENFKVQLRAPRRYSFDHDRMYLEDTIAESIREAHQSPLDALLDCGTVDRIIAHLDHDTMPDKEASEMAEKLCRVAQYLEKTEEEKNTHASL